MLPRPFIKCSLLDISSIILSYEKIIPYFGTSVNKCDLIMFIKPYENFNRKVDLNSIFRDIIIL